jgi:hypothetical protein
MKSEKIEAKTIKFKYSPSTNSFEAIKCLIFSKLKLMNLIYSALNAR